MEKTAFLFPGQGVQLSKQLVSPVRWEESILKMIDEGIEEFIEIGPKKVLTLC